MMMRQITLLTGFFFFSLALQGQSKTLHIVTKKNNLPSPLKFNFEVNGQAYRLKGGECLDIPVRGDSAHIRLFDKRVIKQPTRDLHIPKSDTMRVWIYFSFEGYFKNGRFVAEAICKSCFDEIRAACR